MNTSEHRAHGVIFDIDHFSTHDGPGIRSVVYLKGCPLRCAWCHSPESQSFAPEPLRIPDKCASCKECATSACPRDAWRMCGREVSTADVLDEIIPDKIFFETSGGGVTLSGGEPLSQSGFAYALLLSLQEAGIHTVLETSGMAKWEDLSAISSVADLIYFDIKAADSKIHRRFTGMGNEGILSNLKRLLALRQGEGIVLRVPLIPGYNDSNGDVTAVYALAAGLGAETVHLLPYNISAGAKYEWLSRSYAPGLRSRQSPQRLAELCALAPPSLKVSIV